MRNLHETHSSGQLSSDIGRRKIERKKKKEVYTSKIPSCAFYTVIRR